MKGKTSPVFQLFHQQFSEAKNLFAQLSKQMKGKKALELEQKLIVMQIYIHLLARVHFVDEKLKFEVFSPFNLLKKQLRKVRHLKQVTLLLEELSEENQLEFNSYSKQLDLEKKQLYTDTYDLIIKTPLKDFDEMYVQIFEYSKGISPLTINTATTQIINDELEFFQFDRKNHLDTKALKEIQEGLVIITALENFRMQIGFNPVYVPLVHEAINGLQKLLKDWSNNHLLIQHLTYFLSERDEISKKYQDVLLLLKTNKKRYTAQVEEKCHELFDKIIA
jgi:hypothetical protein